MSEGGRGRMATALTSPSSSFPSLSHQDNERASGSVCATVVLNYHRRIMDTLDE